MTIFAEAETGSPSSILLLGYDIDKVNTESFKYVTHFTLN
jgi:hypothetical protein